MATIPEEVLITAEAAELISALGDGFDKVVLEIARHLASKRSEGHRDVSVLDVKEAISMVCKSLEKSLENENMPVEAKQACQQLIVALRKFGATC